VNGYVSFELNEVNRNMICIPRGCAHGFCAMADRTVVVYMTSSMYSPEDDAGVHFDSFGMKWPASAPIISDRDKRFPALGEFISPFNYKKQI
jgi:dTDP-4-dehydrorhamnose 3,5-epimerase